MNQEDVKMLKKHRVTLVRDMNTMEVVDYLVSKSILTDVDINEIMKQSDNKAKNRVLLKILEKRGESAFQKFVEALFETQQLELAKLLSETAIIALSVADKEHSREVLRNINQSLKQKYSMIFRKAHPFSLPFTFDMENTWVSLALKEDWIISLATEHHAELLNRAFLKVKMLIIEGDPATGKTSLMQRLAYEWAKEEQGLLHYDLVVYGEFREVREQTFNSIADLVLECSKKYFSDRKNSLDNRSYENLKKLMNNDQFCEEHKILVLLDGYDESSLSKQCTELNTYLSAKTIDETPLFNIVITTRKGYLSHLHGRKGRFVFAEVLGFKTDEQKKKYISNHFASMKNSAVQIPAVHHLLNNNQNLSKLAETPLFLTFVCLVHERIIDGTLLELYCNIIWWLIDRHQQDYPDRDIPCSFEFRNGTNDKFETIQEHYLHFPQLHCLGKLALNKLQENVFTSSDCEQFKLQPIIEQVGLLRKERQHDNSFKLTTSYFFPHRTIQEFLAAFYYFCSKIPTNEWLLPNSKFDTSNMNEFEKFLLRIALSNKMPVQTEIRKYYFDKIDRIELDFTFDAFNTTTGFNNKLLNWFLSQCKNMQNITLYGKLNCARHELSKFRAGTSIHNESTVTSKISSPTLFSFCDLTKLHSLEFWKCTFEANSQLSFTNCPSLKNLQLRECKVESGTTLGVATLPSIEALTFERCTFEANSQLSFTNCPSLKNLQFIRCEMKISTNLGFATLPAINTMGFSRCKIVLTTWQSFTDAIRNSSVKYLKLRFGEDFNKEFLIHLQKCSDVEKMEITIQNYKIRQNDLLSFCDLIKLQSVTFGDFLSGCIFKANSQLTIINCPSLKNMQFIRCGFNSCTNIGMVTLPSIEILTFEKCTFEANSQLSFTNCPSLKNLQFSGCDIQSSTNLGFAALPAIDTVGFYECGIDLATWQSITDQNKNSSLKCLKLSSDVLMIASYSQFLHHLQKCERIEEIHVKDIYDSNVYDYILNSYEEEVTANLAQTAQKLQRLRCITIILDANGRRLKERNKERIEKAGQERNHNFLIKYVE